MRSTPVRIVCTTTEGMDPKRSLLRVFDADGAQVDSGNSQVHPADGERRSISVSLDPSKIKDGIYRVKWNTLSVEDGDAADGAFQFTVGR